MTHEEVLQELRALGDLASLAGMARFGITPDKAFGVSMPALRRLGRRVGTDSDLAAVLWADGYRETRILAGLVEDPALVTEEQAESWALDFNDWEICDQTCMNLLARSAWAWPKALEWSGRPEEFVKRAGFVLMARLALGEKRTPDEAFEPFLALIERESPDRRPYVYKGISWALRQIGKRNAASWRLAMPVAERLAAGADRSSRWIGRDAARELNSAAVRQRLQIE